MKYLFAGGGTGGHIFPAIAIADELRKLDSNAEILFVGAKGRIEEKIVPSYNYPLETIEIAGIDRSRLVKNLKLPFLFMRALNKCDKIIRRFRPDAAVGTGGFVCGPVIYQAQRSGIPTLIQEGNAFAGQTVKFLASRSSRVVINFEETLKYLKRKDNVIRIAHPIRSSLKRTDRVEALKEFGLTAEVKTLFVFGGSQGARGINNLIKSIAERLNSDKVNLIWQTGRSDAAELKKQFEIPGGRIRILEFIENIDKAYSASDLVVCRAGITSIMELAYMKMPSVLIPLPGSAEDHQGINADTYASSGAARVVRQEQNAEKLYEEVTSILNDEELQSEMSESAGSFADPLAAEKIATEVIKLSQR